MTPQRTLPDEGQLLITLYGSKRTPLTWEVRSDELLGKAVVIAFSVFALLVGTLLFFREVELNRQLTERLLHLEASTKGNAILRPTTTPSRWKTATRTPELAPNPEETANAKISGARVSGVTPQCSGDTCAIEVTLVPSSDQAAQGGMLLVLEAEVPRIGAGTGSSESRKRFFTYPGMETKEELLPKDISQLSRKPFRFQRTLESHTRFVIGKLLRPLALNVYLFDAAGALSFHERYPIEGE